MDNIILYSTGCPKCKVLAKKLDIKGVEYTINDSVEEMQALGFLSAPLLSVNGDVMPFEEAINWVNNKS